MLKTSHSLVTWKWRQVDIIFEVSSMLVSFHTTKWYCMKDAIYDIPVFYKTIYNLTKLWSFWATIITIMARYVWGCHSNPNVMRINNFFLIGYSPILQEETPYKASSKDPEVNLLALFFKGDIESNLPFKIFMFPNFIKQKSSYFCQLCFSFYSLSVLYSPLLGILFPPQCHTSLISWLPSSNTLNETVKKLFQLKNISCMKTMDNLSAWRAGYILWISISVITENCSCFQFDFFCPWPNVFLYLFGLFLLFCFEPAGLC